MKMEKKIEKYLHLYLGCEGEVRHGEIQRLTVKNLNDALNGTIEFKPILRPLSDMTEEELFHVFIMCYWEVYSNDPYEGIVTSMVSSDEGGGLMAVEDNGKWKYGLTITNAGVTFSCNGSEMIVKPFEITRYLLSIGIDLFGLIDCGLAISKQTKE